MNCEWCQDPSVDDGWLDNPCMIAHCLACISVCRHCQDAMRDEVAA